MNVIRIADMQDIDRLAVHRYKIPSLLLMEHAGYGMFTQFKHHFPKRCSVTVISGTGNNGGDGLVLARNLSAHGYHVTVIVCGDRGRCTADFKTNFDMVETSGVTVVEVPHERAVVKSVGRIKNTDVIVDALFGTGLNRPPAGTAKKLIAAMNASDAKRVSLDIPSGLPSVKDGGICVHADRTYTVGLPKDIFFRAPYCAYIGLLSVVPSIFPSELLNRGTVQMLDAAALSTVRIPENRFGDKRSAVVGLVAGSARYPGAAVMAAAAMYRLGAGYIHLVVPGAIRGLVQKKLPPEIVVTGIGDRNTDYFTGAHVPSVADVLSNAGAVCIGCGIGREKETGVFFEAVLPKLPRRTLIDADGLYFLSGQPPLLQKIKCDVIITPHIFEYARITGLTPDAIRENPEASLMAYKHKGTAHIVLKDAITFVRASSSLFIHNHPADGMGKAGMGDVLAGIITALWARGFSAEDAMKLGVYLHGASFRQVRRKRGAAAVMPTDVGEAVGTMYARFFSAYKHKKIESIRKRSV
ncbi:MAG: NAD(P)H-hydrate epimerase [Spirochaetes bacterium]|nr:NAD(P)H-hydrate epimerase [Spirochaetota bacterium]